MTTIDMARITMTIAKLDSHLKKFRVANPQLANDPEACISAGIEAVFPGLSVEEVFVRCEVNSMLESERIKTRNIASNPDKWIDTTIQSDFFRDTVLLPPYIEKDGKTKTIESASPGEINEFLEALEQSKLVQATAFEGAAEECRRHAEVIHVSIEKNKALIVAARAHHVDLAGVRYSSPE